MFEQVVSAKGWADAPQCRQQTLEAQGACAKLDGWGQITNRASLGPKGAWTSSFGQGGDTSSVKLECLAQCVTWSLGAWESRGEGISEACHR